MNAAVRGHECLGATIRLKTAIYMTTGHALVIDSSQDFNRYRLIVIIRWSRL
jgi:hypothetical protein